MADSQQEKEDDKKPHIKKPLNAFMLYMREERPKVVAQCKVKESATINQILGQRVRLSTPPGTCVCHQLKNKVVTFLRIWLKNKTYVEKKLKYLEN